MRYIEPWKWYRDYAQDAVNRGDEKKQQMEQLFNSIQGKDDDTRIGILTDGANLARQLNEPYWYVLFEHSRCIHVFIQADRKQESLDIIVRLIVEVRKPEYRNCPYLANVYETMIENYVTYDPLSYAKEIEDGIQYTIDNLAMSQSTHAQLLRWQTELKIAEQDWQAARLAGEQYQRLSVRHYDFANSAVLLCEIAYRLDDMNLLKEQIAFGKSMVEQADDKFLRFDMRVWELIWSFYLGVRVDRYATLSALSSFTRKNNTFALTAQSTRMLYYFRVILKDYRTAFESKAMSNNVEQPYLRATHALRRYYLYTQINPDERTASLGVDLNKSFRGISKLPYIIAKPLALIFLIILLPIGLVKGAFVKPEEQLMKEAEKFAKECRKPEPYLERVQRVKNEIRYLP